MQAKKGERSAGFFLLLTAMVLILPLRWVAAFVLSAAVHEAGHYIAIRIFAGRGLRLHIFGHAARMPLPQMSRWKELVCAVAGPFTGLSLLLLGRWMPRTAICALGQSVFNLLPIYPLDGGRALQCLLSMIMPPPRVEQTCKIIGILCRCMVLCLAVYAAFCFDLGLIPLIIAAVTLFRIK